MCACAGTLEQVLNAEWHRWNFRSGMNFMHPASPHLLDHDSGSRLLSLSWLLHISYSAWHIMMVWIMLWNCPPRPLYIHILILTEEAKLSDCIIQSVFDCSDIFMTIQILVLPNFDCSGEEGTGLCESVTNVANAHDILFLPDPIFGSVICLCINWINKSFPELYTSMILIIHISFTPILNFCSFSSFLFQNIISDVM